MKFYKDLM